MKKNLFILAALLLPASLCGQSALGQALQQLESLTGMSIHDINVPDPGDPVPVDPDPEEEQDEPKSTRLKDYTPAQEQETPEQKRYRELLEETQRREEEIRKQVHEEFLRDSERRYRAWKSREDRMHQEWEAYNSFLNNHPQAQPVPVFSSINEHKILLPEPKSLSALSEFGNFKESESDSAYKADIILCSTRQAVPAYFLGRRLENGRTEWRMFINELGEYTEKLFLSGFSSDFDYHQIKDVRLVAEGRVIVMEMYDGTSYVVNPHGSLICHGRNISFPAMSGDVLFIECDGGLHASNAPTTSSQPILRGEHLDYYRNSVIVTNHSVTGEPYYQLYSYCGRAYDWTENTWPKYGGITAFDYIAPFSNEGDYFVLKPQGKKDYFIVSFNKGQLYRGKKKYKSLEAAHAGWLKERIQLFDTMRNNPQACAQHKDSI